MPSDYISFKDTNYFSNLICDYLDRSENLNGFYNRFPMLDNFKFQIEEKSKSYHLKNRLVLHNVLKSQSKNTDISEKTALNIDLLKFDNTFTVTTGHQLNLFTGPLYFLYKIISTINLTQQLKEHYPEYNFVPVYWMATEDHDFEEINYFNFEGKKVQWNKYASGAVGRLSTQGLDQVFEAFSAQLDKSFHAEKIKNIFKKAYLEHDNLAEATQYLANVLFGDLGLVIIDADHKDLKELFIPYLKNDILEHKAQKQVEQTDSKLDAFGYKTQVNPREINLFYLRKNYRERIVVSKDGYKTHDSNYKWTQSE
ncbi:MAG: bacillithiol biosynthesis cysteine-adding enzyme BshC, partial [Bacteroidia bacterium]|nr:bacillithiol biosynthesis cysteine-adding enzyme BshC [Bacteroidia bacterium]